jgi:hypothetical protein
MKSASITYFDKPGKDNTAATAKAVTARVKELGIKHVVVATTSGDTALAFHKALKGLEVHLVAVSYHAGFSGTGDENTMSEARRKQLEKLGVPVLRCSHALSGVGRSISKKFGGISHTEIIAYALRLFGCDGVKVAVEVAVMAADAGLVPTSSEIIAVGGSGKGCDAALVLKAAHMNNFFDLEVREILAKTRQRK